MDHRFSKHVTGVSMKPTRGLLLSKPDCSLSAKSSKINDVEREVGLAVWIKNHVSLGPKLIEIAKHKLSHGAKIIQFGNQGKTFRKNFSVKEGEKLLQASHCCLYTTAGAISGILFVSTERVAFCSNRSIKTYSTTGEMLKFLYKVSIPLLKIKEYKKA